jgi:hypothetical protein
MSAAVLGCGHAMQSALGMSSSSSSSSSAPSVTLAQVYAGCATPPASYANTWNATPSTFSSVLSQAQGGDVIYLSSGAYGAVSITSHKFTQFLTIKAASGQTPIFTSLQISSNSHMVFDGLTVIGGGTRSVVGTMVTISSSDNIVFKNGVVESMVGAFPWVMQNVLTSIDATVAPGDGINASQDYCIALTGNQIQKVFNGIYVGGDQAGTNGQNYLVANNNIDSFAGDGIDHSATNIHIHGNRITNSIDICDLQCIHNDGIQGWNFDDRLGILNSNVLIDDNFLVSQTTPNLFLASTDMHGISIFDGFWQNVTVENNVVLTSSISGITIAGVNGLQIINNTVLDIPLNGVARDMSAWMFSAVAWITAGGTTHEGGATSNVIIRNNIASMIAATAVGSSNCPATESFCPKTPDPSVVIDHNVSLAQNGVDRQTLFTTFNATTSQYNLTLKGAKGTNSAIGSGSATLMPSVDITGASRSSAAPDLGAYAFSP